MKCYKDGLEYLEIGGEDLYTFEKRKECIVGLYDFVNRMLAQELDGDTKEILIRSLRELAFLDYDLATEIALREYNQLIADNKHIYTFQMLRHIPEDFKKNPRVKLQEVEIHLEEFID